jgi:hypothetical protein
MEHPTGEADDGSLRVDFDRRLRLEFHGSRITSDAGILAHRELDDVLGLTDLAGAVLSECRRGKNTRHLLTGLFRQSVFTIRQCARWWTAAGWTVVLLRRVRWAASRRCG